MSDFFNEQETRDPAEREFDLFRRLPGHLVAMADAVHALAERLAGIDLATITSRDALAAVPVMRKPELMETQQANPPFGGFVNVAELAGKKVFQSPGPIYEPLGADPAEAARALYATGLRKGDMVHNALSYHLTPGASILEDGALALGCTVFPGGIGNTDAQVEAAAAFKPVAYTGTPDYLKVMLDRAEEMGADLSSITKAQVSGGALFPSMRAEYAERGVTVLQSYATADLGVVAYESMHEGALCDGMIVGENLIVELVRPGSDTPVGEGEVGEIVVTNFSTTYPLVRFGTGDLSAFIDEPSPCGRTNKRIKGWMGRADQRTKVKGMFVDPKQIDTLLKRHPDIAAARLTVKRDGAQDAMVLTVKPQDEASPDTNTIAASLRDITKLGGHVEIADSLPNDGKVISDERDYDA